VNSIVLTIEVGSNGASQAILDSEAYTFALLWHTTPPNPDEEPYVDILNALKTYQAMRLPPTARIVMANRGNGPDQVMQVAEERSPNGFENVTDVISQEELDEIGRKYKEIAGFDVKNVNKRAGDTAEMAEQLGLKTPKSFQLEAESS
jgi:hypothetical protein